MKKEKNKTIAIIIMGLILLTIAGIVGVNYYNDAQLEQDNAMYNQGVNSAVRRISETVINDGYIELTLPTIDENNQTGTTQLILIQYVKPKQ